MKKFLINVKGSNLKVNEESVSGAGVSVSGVKKANRETIDIPKFMNVIDRTKDCEDVQAIHMPVPDREKRPVYIPEFMKPQDNRSIRTSAASRVESTFTTTLSPYEIEELTNRIKAMSPEEMEIVVDALPIEYCFARIEREDSKKTHFVNSIVDAFAGLGFVSQMK